MIPIAFDDEPTFNQNARQTALKGYAGKRKQLAELKRKQALKAKQAKRKRTVVSRSNSAESTEYIYEVTAYTAGYESTGKRPGDAGYGVTSSGEYVKEGVTVACPKSLAFGTRLHIKGVGYRICYDRGGDIVNGRLDVYIADLAKAQNFGRQTLKVRILRKGAD